MPASPGSQHGRAARLVCRRSWLAAATTFTSRLRELFEDAAQGDREGRAAAGDIDGVVTVSTTGIATPSLEARAGPGSASRSVRRVPVFGLGCAGGVSGLATAARLAAAEPGSRWLFVCVETCSISIRLDTDDPAALVATALFGDGAAAAVVSTEGEGPPPSGAGERLWPDTLGIMGWRVEDPGLAVVFDRAIPPFVTAELAAAIDGILRHGPHPQRHRPALLAPGRRQGHHRHREGAGAPEPAPSTSSARCCTTMAT
jgi:alkylresorcinol/alkylpyrone synthase